MALEFLAGAPFQLMYDMVKVALGNTKLFRSQLRKLENILKKLQPQILEQIRLNNVQLHLSTVHIDELRQKIKYGLLLLEKLSRKSNFNVHVWGFCLKPRYADQLEDLISELEVLLEIVKLEDLPLLGRVTLSAESTEGKVDEVSSNLKLLTLSAASTEGKVDEVSCDLKLLSDTVADLKELVHGIQLEGISPPVETPRREDSYDQKPPQVAGRELPPDSIEVTFDGIRFNPTENFRQFEAEFIRQFHGDFN